MNNRPERAELGIDGNAGFSLLGPDLQEGEAEFVTVKQVGDEPFSRAEIRAARHAHENLEKRLGRKIDFYFGSSHPYGD